MVTIDSLIHLVKHYHLENDDDCFNKAVCLAEKELCEVLNEEREYPPFIYYLCLEHLDRNPNYKNCKTFSCMNNDEKTNVFNETICELRKLID